METGESPCPPRRTGTTEHAVKLAEKTIVTIPGFSHDFSLLVCSFLSSVVYSQDGGNRHPLGKKIPDQGGKNPQNETNLIHSTYYSFCKLIARIRI